MQTLYKSDRLLFPFLLCKVTTLKTVKVTVLMYSITQGRG